MDNRDFSNIGEQIRRSVEDAMHSMDFEQLNKNISDSVNYALDEARKNLTKAASGVGEHGSQNGAGTVSEEQRQEQQRREQQGRDDRGRQREHRAEREQDREQRRSRYAESVHKADGPVYRPFSSYKSNVTVTPGPEVTGIRVNAPSKVPGILYTVFGSIGIGVTGVLFLVVILIALVMKPLAGVMAGSSVFLTLLAAVFGTMLAVGNSKRGLLKRLNAYLGEARGRMFCSVEELARVAGKSEAYVVKDIKRIIARGILPEAHLDDQKTCLMLDNQTYHQYLEAQKGYQERKRLTDHNGKRKKEEPVPKTAASKESGEQEPQDELQKMMAAGRDYVRVLREANDAIPGESISFKLGRLETVISRIFETVEKHPEQMKEMERFMDYYLPTTVKLVNAYRDFDSANIEGTNITSAKQEIEQTLDTINQAFERLLDDLYQDAVLDASTDASVLQTMLKKEGFTDSDFRRKEDE